MPEPTQDRIFGVPTVRHDIRRPRNKRVTDCQDYGDSKTSAQLVNPSPFVEFGLDEDVCPRASARTRVRDCARVSICLAGGLCSSVRTCVRLSV